MNSEDCCKLRDKAQRAYWSMQARCRNPKVKGYERYGGRGIKCFFNSSQELIDHIGLPPTPAMTIDRIDPNGNYEFGNVRWASMKLQSNNRRSNNVIEINGVKKTLSQWADESGIPQKVLYLRIVRRKWDPVHAITLPMGTVYKVFLRKS